MKILGNDFEYSLNNLRPSIFSEILIFSKGIMPSSAGLISGYYLKKPSVQTHYFNEVDVFFDDNNNNYTTSPTNNISSTTTTSLTTTTSPTTTI